VEVFGQGRGRFDHPAINTLLGYRFGGRGYSDCRLGSLPVDAHADLRHCCRIRLCQRVSAIVVRLSGLQIMQTWHLSYPGMGDRARDSHRIAAIASGAWTLLPHMWRRNLPTSRSMGLTHKEAYTVCSWVSGGNPRYLPVWALDCPA